MTAVRLYSLAVRRWGEDQATPIVLDDRDACDAPTDHYQRGCIGLAYTAGGFSAMAHLTTDEALRLSDRRRTGVKTVTDPMTPGLEESIRRRVARTREQYPQLCLSEHDREDLLGALDQARQERDRLAEQVQRLEARHLTVRRAINEALEREDITPGLTRVLSNAYVDTFVLDRGEGRD